MVQDICEVSNSESISLVNYGIIPEGTDISPNTDGGLFKAIKKEGDKSSLPLKGNKIFCHYEGKFTDGTVFDSSKQRNEQFSFLLGKGIAFFYFTVTMMRRTLLVIICFTKCVANINIFLSFYSSLGIKIVSLTYVITATTL